MLAASGKELDVQKICGMILFSAMTQLDLTGPYEILCRVPGLEVVVLLSATGEPVQTEHGLRLAADRSFDAAPALDVLLVPGGPGVNQTLIDERHIRFVRRAAQGAQWVSGVCTGALLLGAAGLLRGYRATTHWCSIDFLSTLGAIPVSDQRVVVDRNRITSAGVTAGIDLALALVARVVDEPTARRIQLAIEYDPEPPFDSGSPAVAKPETVAAVREDFAKLIEERGRLVELAARRW
jgi:cyclohexyl-isocyanide hydratase